MAMGQSIKDAAAFIKGKPDEAFAFAEKSASRPSTTNC